MKNIKLLLILILLLTSNNLFSQWQKLTQRLQDKLSITEQTQFIKALVVLDDQVDIESMDSRFYSEKASIERRTYEVITALKEKAERTQQSLRSFLFQKTTEELIDYNPLWIVNAIVIEATPGVIYQLVSFGEVGFIDFDAVLEYDRPIFSDTDPTANRTLAQVEPGLKIINADKLWALGITGNGRIVMGMDTGVDGNHPALNYKWRGTHVPQEQAWFDTYSTTTFPADCDGHGTHTMGTMTGLSPAGDTIGVAIGAEWIAARTICTSPHTSNSMAAFQWAMDPDENPNTISDMPDAINNSWYDPNTVNECSGAWKQTFDAVEAVGIAVVFSAGNSGPTTSSITMPKNINTDEVDVFATGAINGSSYLSGSTDPIASFSSRGPSDCGGTGSLLIKPEACAPGVNIRSSVPGGGYDGTYQGTSMASPHVTGAIALLKQYAPQLTGKQIKMALYNTAKDLGAVGEDNNYGKGLIDVYAAFQTLGIPDQTPPTQITDLAISDITSNGLKLTWTAPDDTSMGGVVHYDIRYSTTTITDSASFYSATELAFGAPPAAAGTAENLNVDELDFSTPYYFAIRSSDTWGNWSLISNVPTDETLDAPVILVDPATMHQTLPVNVIYTDSVVVSNTSVNPSTLSFDVELANNTFPTNSVEVSLVPIKSQNPLELTNDKDKDIVGGGQAIEGSGGPDDFGYRWIDSDDPNGPSFVWNDISSTGTPVSFSNGTLDDGWTNAIPLGFSFKYYGNLYSSIYISTNGIVSLTALTTSYTANAAIPTTAAPNNVIFPFWDDLEGRTQGTVHYQQIGSKFYIQFTNWQKYTSSGGTGSLTFQIELTNTGKIMLYYQNMVGTLNSATVGIENAAGDDGLQIAYNATYIKNDLAIQIASEPDWLQTNYPSGLLYNGNSAAIELNFNTTDLPDGEYSMDLIIISNDPVHPSVTVPVTMTVGVPDVIPPFAITDLSVTSTTSSSATLEWTAPSDNPTGNVSDYDIRYSENPIANTTDFNNATQAAYSGTPAVAGSAESFEVNGLDPNTHYYFAIVSSDLSNNTSDLSNVAEGTTQEPGPSPWSMELLITDNGGGVEESKSLIFGQDPTATDGIDALLGENQLPPIPPAGNYDIRFVLPSNIWSMVDFRNSDSTSIRWQLNFQPGAGGYPITFTWDSTGFPSGTFFLTDIAGGVLINIDMKTTDSYTLTNTGISSLFIQYEAGSTLNMRLDVNAGWNIVSVPLRCAFMAADSLFANAVSDAFSYNGAYTAASDLETGVGYWLKFAADESIDFSGAPVDHNIPVAAGWNIIGPFHEPVPIANITTDPAGIIQSDFFEYDGSYIAADTLQAGKGYWIKVSDAGELILNVVKKGAISKSQQSSNQILISLVEIPIIASDGISEFNINLLAGIDPAATNGIDESFIERLLPPAAPGFDARFIITGQSNNFESYRDIKQGGENASEDFVYKLNYKLESGSKGLTLNFSVPAGVSMNIKDLTGGSLIDQTFDAGIGKFFDPLTAGMNGLKITLTYNGSQIPVELTSFAAVCEGADVVLSWKTLTEMNNKGFDVERKGEDNEWSKVGYVEGKGTTMDESEYRFTDKLVNAGGKEIFYRLRQIDINGTTNYSEEIKVEILPQQYVLEQNYPNPFNPNTTIKYAIPYESKVKLEVYNTLAQKVSTLVNENQSAGFYEVKFNAMDLSSGIYFYILTAEPSNKSKDFKTVRKMVLVK
ncbi:MAG: S8 family serine peptidase [bacterium]